MILSLILSILLAGQGASGGPAAAAPACTYTQGADTIAVPGHAFAAAPTADGCWLFVSLNGQGRMRGVAVLKNVAGRFTLVRTVPLRDNTFGLSLTHDGALLMVAGGDAVDVLSVPRLQGEAGDPVLGRAAEGPGAGSIELIASGDDRLLFVSEEQAARVVVLDLERVRRGEFGAKAVIGYVPQGLAPVGLALSPDGRFLFATSQRMPAGATFPTRCQAESEEEGGGLHPEGGLSLIDVARARTDPAHALLAVAPAGCNPVRVGLSGDGARAWVTARGENAVYGFDVAGLTATPPKPSRTRYPAGDSPVGVAVQPGSGVVWVSDSNRFSPGRQGELQSIALAPGQAPVVLRSRRFPRDLAFLPDGRTLVVAQFGSDAVQLAPVP